MSQLIFFIVIWLSLDSRLAPASNILLIHMNLSSYISISISIIYLPSGTRGVVAQSPEPGAHDKSD